MSGSHPSDDALGAELPDVEVAAHLAVCAACRTLRRDLLAYDADVSGASDEAFTVPGDLQAWIRRDAESARALPDDRRWIGTGARGASYVVRRNGRAAVLRIVHDADVPRLAAAVARLGTVSHPHLAPFLSFSAGPPATLTRDCVEGDDLAAAARHAPAQRAVRWAGQLASALVALHAVGLAHGGLKASNVRIRPGGRLVLVDAALEPATPADDWRAFGRLFAEQGIDLGDAVREPDGAQVCGALLLAQGTRYARLQQLDAGGMGELWRARDPVLRRVVALKRMREAIAASPDGERRFLAEAQIAAQLQHPNIVPVHEIDYDEDGTPFFTMKLISGKTLATAIDELHGVGWPADPALRRAIEVFERLCDAVAYAHSRGVAHLDVKPRNVLVGEYGEVQLLDWGAARSVSASAAPVDLDPSGVHRITATPGWRAPEQREPARSAEIGAHSDVYSLGVVLHQLLTGRRPGLGDHEGRFAPVRSLAPRAPRELASIAEKALADSPGDRYPDAAALGADVQAWLRGEAVAAHRYSVIQSFERRTRGQRATWTFGLVAALALGTVSWFAVLGWQESVRSGERERERQGQVLAEQARLALVAGDRIAAEGLAARAVDLADTPDGRGLLARLWRVPYPRREPISDEDTATDDGCGAWTVEIAPDRSGFRVSAADGDVILGGPRTSDTTPPEPWRQANGRPVCDPSGDHVAFGSGDQVRVWRLRAGSTAEIAILPDHGGDVVDVAWSPDGRLLAAADRAGAVRLWHVDPHQQPGGRPPREIARLPDHGDIQDLSFVARPEPVLRVRAERPAAWRLARSAAPHRIGTSVPVAGVAWSARDLATLDRHGNLRTWDPATGALRRTTADVAVAAFSEDGASVAVFGDGVIRVTDEGGAERATVRAPGMRALAWVGPVLIAAGDDGALRRFDATGAELAPWTGVGGPVTHLAPVPRGVIALGADGRASWVADGQTVARWEGIRLATAAAGHVALAREDGSVFLASSPAQVVSSGAEVLGLALASDGDTLAVARADQTVRVYVRAERGWDEAARNVSADLRGVAWLAISPVGDALAVAGAGPSAEIWDLTVLREPPARLLAEVATRYGARSEVAP